MCLDEIALKGQGCLTVVSVSLLFLPNSKREKKKGKQRILKFLPDFSIFSVNMGLSIMMINEKCLFKYTVISKFNIHLNYFQIGVFISTYQQFFLNCLLSLG